MSTRYFLSSTNSDLSGGADFSKKLDANPGFGTTLAVTVAASATETSYGFTEALVPGRRGSVGIQEYALAVNVVVAANQNLKLRLRRITAAGTVQASSAETPTQSLNSTGVKLFEIYADLGRFEKDERIRLDFIFTDLSGSGTTVTIELDTGETWFLAPWDAGLLRPNMREALESAYVEGVWLVELDLPSPNVGGSVTTVRGALQGASASIGDYPANISSISRIPMGVSLTASGIESPEVTIEWQDPEGEIARIFEGPNGDDVVGSASRIRFAVAGLVEADWHSRFVGIVKRRQFLGATLTWRIVVGVDDRQLTRGEVPRVRVTKTDLTDAPDEVVDQVAPQLWGIWNSVGVSGKGAVPTIYVDTVNFRYLVCHFFGQVDRVYADGVLLSASAWTQVLVTINGRTFMLIDFTSDQGNAVITCDVKGYFSIGTGLPFERPIEMLYTWLENFVVSDGNAGITSIGLGPLNNRVSEVVRDFYEDAFDLVGAVFLDVVKKPDTYVQEFLTTWNYRGYWGVDGRLVIKPMDHRTTAIYLDDPWARGPEDTGTPPDVDYEEKDLADRVIVSYLQDAAAGGFARTLEVRDPSVESDVSETFEMSWGAAKII